MPPIPPPPQNRSCWWSGGRGTRITAINRAAQQAGAHVGQMLTDARAACPLLMVYQAQPEADDDMLQRLALWAGRYSPITSIDTVARQIQSRRISACCSISAAVPICFVARKS